MARRKLKYKDIRQLIKIGKTSLGLTIPIEIAGKLKLRERQKVKVKLQKRNIVIRDWEK